MPVPKAILDVERPPATAVVDQKSNGPHRYAVRIRIGVKYVKGGNAQPIYGRIIGHIIEGRFVSRVEEKQSELPVSYGTCALIRTVIDDILCSLIKCFNINDAYRIIVIAMIRVMHPNISSSRLSTTYDESYLSIFYPNVHISKNTVCEFLKNIGKNTEGRKLFFQDRISFVSKKQSYNY